MNNVPHQLRELAKRPGLTLDQANALEAAASLWLGMQAAQPAARAIVEAVRLCDIDDIGNDEYVGDPHGTVTSLLHTIEQHLLPLFPTPETRPATIATIHIVFDGTPDSFPDWLSSILQDNPPEGLVDWSYAHIADPENRSGVSSPELIQIPFEYEEGDFLATAAAYLNRVKVQLP